MTPFLSIIIPTRSRSSYLRHSLQTCFQLPESDVEILVLDNCSDDDTSNVLTGLRDARLRVIRHAHRLSMRDNFEAGLLASKGEIVGFIGDDDGILPNAATRLRELFENPQISAVTAERCHYSWPCLQMPRRNCALIPRGNKLTVRNSRQSIQRLLRDTDYYRLPCLYHGFVRKSVTDSVVNRCGRIFISSIPDVASVVALSCENLMYIHSESPLVINGGSIRSNGASHARGGSETERDLWKSEDDLGLLGGLDMTLGIEALILETALRYTRLVPNKHLSDIFDSNDLIEIACWLAGKLQRRTNSLADRNELLVALGLDVNCYRASSRSNPPNRRLRQLQTFVRSMPLDLARFGVQNVFDASQLISDILLRASTGYSSNLLDQLRAVRKLVG